MCLNIKWYSWKHTAKKDIIVYKYLDKCNDNTLKTPYRGVIIEISKTYISVIERIDNVIEKALHSFAQQKGAQDNLFNQIVIVECIIPKGSYYYTGKFIGHKAYASNKLIYKRIIS